MTDVFRKEYKPLSDYQKDTILMFKVKAQELLEYFESVEKVDPRMMALAKTNLEQSIMWAIKSIT